MWKFQYRRCVLRFGGWYNFLSRLDHVQSSSSNENEIYLEEQCVMPQQELKKMGIYFGKWFGANIIWFWASFQGITALLSFLSNLGTPFEVLRNFSDETLFEKIVEQSNLYAIQKNVNKPTSLASNYIKQFFGICMYMSVVHMLNIRRYCSTKGKFPQVKAIMSQNRFEFIKSA